MRVFVVKALQGEVLVLQTEANRLQKLCDLVRPALPGLKPKLSAEVNVTSATSSVTAVDPASPSTSDTGAKPLTGVDKKEAYWKEKLKASKGKAVEKTGKDAATTAAEQAVVTLEEAKPKHVGLGSGPVSGTVTTSATASAKYAVNRLPSSAEVAMAGYKPGLNSMGSKP